MEISTEDAQNERLRMKPSNECLETKSLEGQPWKDNLRRTTSERNLKPNPQNEKLGMKPQMSSSEYAFDSCSSSPRCPVNSITARMHKHDANPNQRDSSIPIIVLRTRSRYHQRQSPCRHCCPHPDPRQTRRCRPLPRVHNCTTVSISRRIQNLQKHLRIGLIDLRTLW